MEQTSGSSGVPLDVPHGTTIVAVVFAGGVLIAGDRRGTSGTMIATRELRKVYVTDEYSAVGIAGAAATRRDWQSKRGPRNIISLSARNTATVRH